MLPPPIVKSPLLVLEALGALTLLTRIRACAVAGPVTCQLYTPLLAVLLVIVAHVPLPFRDNSISTLPVSPLEVQLIVWVLPMGQVSPPLGEMTMMLLLTERLAVKVLPPSLPETL